MSEILVSNEFGTVELKALFEHDSPRPVITVTKLPDDVVAALKSHKIRVTLPAQAYIRRARPVAGGKYVPFKGLELESIKIPVSVETRPGLLELWEAQDAYDTRRQQEAEQKRRTDRDQFIAACPVGSVVVNHTGSVPDPWEVGMSISVYSDKQGRKFEGLPQVRSSDGTLGYVAEADMAIESARVSAQEAKKAAKDQAEADRKRAEREKEAQRVAGLTQLARETGQPQVVDRWVTEDCTRHNPDCSFDAAVRAVHPDGTIKMTYTCCH